jgi:hypothetical protein
MEYWSGGVLVKPTCGIPKSQSQISNSNPVRRSSIPGLLLITQFNYFNQFNSSQFMIPYKKLLAVIADSIDRISLL